MFFFFLMIRRPPRSTLLSLHDALPILLQVEAIRTAQEKYGKGKVMTSEQVRWGLENLNLTQERLNELGFGKIIRPVKTSCDNHLGTDWSQIGRASCRERV